jgi:hypothetical protein
LFAFKFFHILKLLILDERKVNKKQKQNKSKMKNRRRISGKTEENLGRKWKNREVWGRQEARNT